MVEEDSKPRPILMAHHRKVNPVMVEQDRRHRIRMDHLLKDNPNLGRIVSSHLPTLMVLHYKVNPEVIPVGNKD